MNTPILETSRLILRKFTERDMEALFLILKDEEANKFLPWYPVKDLEETRRFYQERYAAKYGQPQAYAYAISATGSARSSGIGGLPLKRAEPSSPK